MADYRFLAAVLRWGVAFTILCFLFLLFAQELWRPQLPPLKSATLGFLFSASLIFVIYNI